jgi:hypothetical protein
MMEARAVPLDVRCGPEDWAVVTPWQKLLLGLAVCLPIPVLALSGMAVPLPAVVYRAAAAFVERTEELAGVLARDESKQAVPVEFRLVPRRTRAVVESPVAERAAVIRVQSVRGVVGRSGSSVRTATPRAASLAPKRSSSPRTDLQARTKSEPKNESARPTAQPTVTTAGPSAPASAPEVRKERPVNDPVPESTNVAPVEPPRVAPPSPPPPAPPPPPEPRLLEPVTKPLEPVTETLKPLIGKLEPVTAPTSGLRLLGP